MCVEQILTEKNRCSKFPLTALERLTNVSWQQIIERWQIQLKQKRRERPELADRKEMGVVNGS